jgi:DNA-binding beta-propeller fold protein YncE
LQDIERPPLWTVLISGPPPEGQIGVVSSDLGSSGRFSVMHLDGVALPTCAAIHSDARARYANGKVYIVNRLNRDNIQILNSHLAYLTESEFSVGGGSNPHDIAVLNGSRAYVSLYNRDYILIVNPANGVETGRISLKGYIEPNPPSGVPDGLPEAHALLLYGNRLYVSLQNLDRNSTHYTYPPYGRSLLVEINTNTNAITGAYPFPFQNPFSDLIRTTIGGSDAIVTALPGYLGFDSRIDGGVVAFNPVTRSFFSNPLYTESSAGGDILNAVVKNDTEGFAVVEYADLSTAIHRFNPSTGQKVSVIAHYPPSGGYVSGVLLSPDGRLYAGENGFSNPGVSIFDTNAGDRRLTPLPVNIGLRPTDLIYMR